MKKHLLIMISCITMHNYAMEISQSLPNETIESILRHSLPKLNLYYEKTHKPGRLYYTEKGIFPDSSADKDAQDGIKATHNLQEILAIKTTFRCINKYWNTWITNNIPTLLEINKDNVNGLLIRAAQANIPYFIKMAVAHKADLNFVHKPDGYTPLLYATKNNHYDTCKFLLEHDASVHIKRDNPYAGYTYNASEWPIYVAIENNNNELVKLFIKHGTKLDFSRFITTSLLSFTAQKNNPYILTTLLEARPQTTWDNYWSEEEIDHALETVSRFNAKTDQEKREQKTCKNMLEQAKEKASKASESMGIFFFNNI